MGARKWPMFAVVVIAGMVFWRWSRRALVEEPAKAPPPIAAQPVAVAQRPTAPRGEGSIRGRVDFTGVAPAPVEQNRAADAFCAKTRTVDESVIVNENKTLKNAVIHVTGLPASAPTSAVAAVEQKGCAYRPRVQAVVAGDRVEIVNGDPTLHNIHGYRGASTLWNQAQLPGSPKIVKNFPDGKIKLKCDVHPWMTAWVAAFPDRYFAVTDGEGSFAIPDVPAGTYTVEAWHETLGTKSAPVTITDGGASELRFAY